jgi:hypothetical protein
MTRIQFSGTLFVYPGTGGWTFVDVPAALTPPRPAARGRTAVRATLNGVTWQTSVWTDRTGKTLLPVAKRVRRGLGEGDIVEITLEYEQG